MIDHHSQQWLLVNILDYIGYIGFLFLFRLYLNVFFSCFFLFFLVGVIIVHQAALGPESQRMTCHHCRADVSTRVENESNSKTHLVALLCCVLG